MSTPEYTPPESEDLSGKATKETTGKSAAKTPAVAAPAATKQAPAVVEATFQEPVMVVGIGKMLNAKGDATTDVMVARIERHMQFLSGNKRYKNKAEEQEEQISFIETVGNSLRLDFDQFVVVTDDLLNIIRQNRDVFDGGLTFRHTVGLDRKYPVQTIRLYHTYMSFLAMVAKNWESRYKLHTLIDLASVITDLNKKGKENVTQYFRYLTNV
jgi:hypothetical protein